jgi:serine/threonine protein kinase
MYAPNLNFKPGDTLDSFQLKRVVATSGMATVFEARRLDTGERVAIKIPHPEVESDPALWERFKREEEIGVRLNHPSVMKVYANPERS